jgi:pimeloyl-ACP methyl ester carboxylesterase
VTAKTGSTAAFFGHFVQGRIGRVRVLLIHGSGGNAESAWAPLQALVDRFEVVAPNRSGYPPGPLLERIDFEEQADELAPLLQDGAHLVGHSYGGLISLLMAARRPESVLSLTVSEPPVFAVARENPEVKRLVAGLEHFKEVSYEPREFAAGFLGLVGSSAELPDPLPPEAEQSIRATMSERSPLEAELPLNELAATPFPKLVISGAHHPAFDAVCDVLERRLGAERAVLPGAGHSIPRAPGYADLLEEFLSR